MKPNTRNDNSNKTRQVQQNQQTQTQHQITINKPAADNLLQTGDQATKTAPNLVDINNVALIGGNGLNFTLSEEKKKEIIHNDVQMILENDLSFCKFCACRWLSKKTECPECRMTVSFQAENLALKNVINTMVQKSSPQFQEKRTNSVKTRLKDEEEQTKKDGVPRILRKDNNNQVGRPLAIRTAGGGVRSRWGRSTFLYLPNMFPATDSSNNPLEGEVLSNSSDSSGSTFPPAYRLGDFDLRISFPDEDDDEVEENDDEDEDHVMDDSDEDEDDDDSIRAVEDISDIEDFDEVYEHDTTFELETEDDSDSDSSQSEREDEEEEEEDEDMDDESYADLDVIGNSDSDSVEDSDDSEATEIEDNNDIDDDSDDEVEVSINVGDVNDDDGDSSDEEADDDDDDDYEYYYDNDEDLTSDSQSSTSAASSSISSLSSAPSSVSDADDTSDEIELY